jgi:hypothetical protein
MLPEVPGDEASMHEDCLVHTMIPYALEEYSPSDQGYLKGVDIDVCAVIMPRVSADPV